MNSLHWRIQRHLFILFAFTFASYAFHFKWNTHRNYAPRVHMKTNIPYEDFGFELVFPGDAREEEKLSDLSLLSPLTRNGTVVSYYLSDLRKKWIDICIDESKTPEEMNGFSISKILPYLYREDARVDIEQDETHLDDLIEETLFITENELKRLWFERSQLPLGKAVDRYSVQEALLLIDDAETEEIIEMGMDLSMDRSAESYVELTDVVEAEEEQVAEMERIVSSAELERIWAKRAKIRWGLPSKNFKMPEALLLLVDGADEDEMYEEDAFSMGDGTVYELEKKDEKTKGYVVFDDKDDDYYTGDNILLNTERGFWDAYTGPDNAELRQKLKAIYTDLEDMTYFRPAWKKESLFMTTDIDSQNFFGDMMLSNTDMTTRIPANWDDPETEGMSEAYLSTGTMAMPGEEETNYNIKLPVWEELNVPYGPPEHQMKFAHMRQSAHEKAIEGSANSDDKIDWSTYDFSQDSLFTSDQEGKEDGSPVDHLLSSVIETTKLKKKPKSSTEEEVDGFFAFQEEESEDELEDIRDLEEQRVLAEIDSLSTEEFLAFYDTLSTEFGFDKYPSTNVSEYLKFYGEIWMREYELRRDMNLRVQEKPGSTANVLGRDVFFKDVNDMVPLAYLRREFSEHVGYDEYSKYNFGEINDAWRDVDSYHALCYQHVMNVTDLYLTDHLARGKLSDEYNSACRLINSYLCNNASLYNQSIPDHYRPDLHRGVEYTDNIIEMKSKCTLEAVDTETWENDSFDYNTEVQAQNPIGTVRVQYDWRPDTSLDHKIEKKKLGRILPVLRFVNHAADLVSTKNDVLVFDYLGRMRHLIGIRASMLQVAQETCPEIKDIRLETERRTDKFDV